MTEPRASRLGQPGVWRWPIDAGSETSVEFRLREVEFGDGYAQRTRDGINATRRTWTVNSTLFSHELLDALDMLDAAGGDVPIDFIDVAWGEPFKAIVKQYRVRHEKFLHTVSMEVRQVFSFP